MKEWTPENEALDDLVEQAEEFGWMTPIQYAKLRGIRPQKVYRWVRLNKVEHKRCDCGRRVVSVRDCDKLQAGEVVLQVSEGTTTTESEGATL